MVEYQGTKNTPKEIKPVLKCKIRWEFPIWVIKNLLDYLDELEPFK